MLGVALEHRAQHVAQDPVGVGPVGRDPGPHRHQRVRETAGPLAELAGQGPAGAREALGGRVVRGREPSVPEPRDPPQAGAGAPAPDPDRHAAVSRRSGRERLAGQRVEPPDGRRRLAAQQRAKHRRRLVEARPPLLERQAEGVVVAFGGARAHPGDHPAVGQHVERLQRLGERHGTAQRDQRHRRDQVHAAAPLDHAGQRGRAVQPGLGEQEVIVGRERGEAALPGRVGDRGEAAQRLPLAGELDQRQMHAELHPQIL